jgi:TRAP-type mannitol/chloroaromatic compound transport system permease small subunit
MKLLLRLAGWIDALNARIGRIAVWLVLLSCLISAVNASIRYAFDMGSNAWIEMQWYMFFGMVLLGAPYVLKMNEHVRVDILYSRMRPRTQATLDLVCMIVFLMPAVLFLAWTSWPLFMTSYASGEMSGNAGGLIRWPVKLILPVGFALLAIQGISEIIKRVGFLMNIYDMDTHYERPLQ